MAESKKAYQARYRERNRAKIAKYMRDYQNRPHPAEKRRARELAKYAVNTGRLVRGKCEQAESGECEGRIEGHHDDYSKPLEVRWLCVKHHRRQAMAAAKTLLARARAAQ